MALFSYYLFDSDARLVDSDTAAHVDILDAFERMRALIDDRAAIAMVQLWQDENFIGHVKRSDGRLILKSRAEPLPTHPLFAQDRPDTKTG